MNVTNRRKSTDADTTPTTQTSHHHHHSQHLTPQQHQLQHLHQHHHHHPHQQPHLPYVSCRQAATTATHQRSSRSELDATEEDQEPVVTSTSSDCLLPLQDAEGEGEEICIDLDSAAAPVLTSSPALITSSTNNYDILSYSSSSHSLILEEDMVMPTTSEHAARIEREETTSTTSSLKHSLRSSSTKAAAAAATATEMVARDTTHTSVANASEMAGRSSDITLRDPNEQQTTAASTSNNSDSHKIILKLPKISASGSCESQVPNNDTEDDPRKVEPLKINLHNTHHHNVHHTPKITIKPILKESAAESASEECSSSAEDDVVSKLSNSEPHIVPKLTIRAKNEDYGSSLTTVVPKLTIKINDSSSGAESKSNAALNTPPLPKLTIKTGQDGHTESIITNVSPASSTNSSSSSLTSSSSANSVTATTMPASSSMATVAKLTIKPIHKSKELVEPQNLAAIPKLCIKTNTLTTDEPEEAAASKIPKLTIKTGQEHAVIITHNNDNLKSSGGIPKMTIKTKSLEVNEDSNPPEAGVVDKIPKLTIKTNNTKAQLVDASGPPLSPKQPVVPKLTISRQTVQAERLTEGGANATIPSIPKMTIKTQSTSKGECVTKLSLKSGTKQRPSSTEESGISDDTEDESPKIMETNKTVPKLTIKNVGSPQQKLKVVMDSKRDTPPHSQESCQEMELISSANEDVDDFNDLLNVDNVGGESSNSQEFCGFNENANTNEDFRRQSDDMDIDESLQRQHEPQIFQNASHFEDQIMSVPLRVTDYEVNGNSLNAFPKLAHIIDTVDLTSSAGSSPAHRFEYNEEEEDEVLEECQPKGENNSVTTNSNILLERLQRETSVIQNAQDVMARHETNAVPPPLHPKPPPVMINNQCTSSRYPQLMERLMTNGLLTGKNNISNNNNNNNNADDYAHGLAQGPAKPVNEENIIDSIEILDTPEGSPRSTLDERPNDVKAMDNEKPPLPNGLHCAKDILEALNNNNPTSLKRLGSNLNDLPAKLRKIQNENDQILTATAEITCEKEIELNLRETNLVESHENDQQSGKSESDSTVTQNSVINHHQPHHQRSRKQKHEHLLQLPMDEVVDTMPTNSLDSLQHLTDMCGNNSSGSSISNNAIGAKKKIGRPRKSECQMPLNAKEDLMNATATSTPAIADNKSRRVQLLRKRLAIDMVDAEHPLAAIKSVTEVEEVSSEVNKNEESNDTTAKFIETAARRERNLRTPLRASRRSNTPTSLSQNHKSKAGQNISCLTMENNNKKSPIKASESVLNNFLDTNALTAQLPTSHATSVLVNVNSTQSLNNSCMSMSTQIDLTMSSSSSNSNGSTTNTITTVEAATTTITKLGGANGNGIVNISGGGGGSSNNSMLPPTTILSSSDPLQDVVFRPNDFSSIIVAQQLKGGNQNFEQSDQDQLGEASGADYSEDDSASSSSLSTTPGRSMRGRGGKGSRGGKAATGRAYRAHRLGRSASAVAKAIAVNRPKWVGTLKHTPDPERIKGLYSPSPQVFEEDTRMSADLNQTTTMPQEHLPVSVRQPDFLNNEESQSSVISNTSILDPNNVAAIQNGSAVKKPVRKKKMEVCVSEEMDYTVASIAEYEWPRPKGCCPSKNRDTFMIQEQVANYLGIKSFKRKYPDLPRRQVDMEERNWLQEQGLVSEKMCDLGITAVWASDILDIMYSDFYEKYEEYKDFVRQKHLREIEAKQKALGLNVAGRGLQARERAILNTSKWNAYFNKTRQEERTSCLDLQTLIINKPCPAAAPLSTFANRPVAESVALAVKMEQIPEPPTLLKPRVWDPPRCRDTYYPLSLVPGQFCEKYYSYTPEELSRFPLNTVLQHHPNMWQRPEEESHSSDTDSAVESIENDVDVGDKSLTSRSKLLKKRRSTKRMRTKQQSISNDDEFKIPPLPKAASVSATSSTDSSSSSEDNASSGSDSDTMCSSSSSDDSESENENSPTTCGVCLHPQNSNLKNLPELFIQCYTCRRKVHPSCIEMPHRMAVRVRNYNWQCAECKCCIKCKGTQDQNKMLFCEQCDRGFHIYCLGVKAVPEGRWSCDRCSICMRCGATKPEGLSSVANQPINKQSRLKKPKWINEYRVDHVTKLKEHCYMLCVPCGRCKTSKRYGQMSTSATHHHNMLNSPGSSGVLSPTCSSGQCSPALASSNTINDTVVPIQNDLAAFDTSSLHAIEHSEKLTTAISASSPATSLSSSSSSSAAATAAASSTDICATATTTVTTNTVPLESATSKQGSSVTTPPVVA